MSKGPPDGFLTSPSRADPSSSSSSSSTCVNGFVIPPPYSDEDPHPSYSRHPAAGVPQVAPHIAPVLDGSAQPPAGAGHWKTNSGIVDPEAFEDWDDDNFNERDPVTEAFSNMPSDLRPPYHRPTDGKSGTPLLGENRKENGFTTGDLTDDGPRPLLRRKSTFKEVDPDLAAKTATRKRYTYAAFFLAVSLISFTIQTETAVYIKKHLGWSKSYAML